MSDRDGNRTELYVERSLIRRSYDLVGLVRHEPSGRLARVIDVQIQTVEVGEAEIVKPFMSLTLEEVQRLMNELWKAGIRPTNDDGTLAATSHMQKHLDDMRAITMALLRKEGTPI